MRSGSVRVTEADSLRPPEKVIAYAARKGVAAQWAAGLPERPSFVFGLVWPTIIMIRT